VAVVIYFLLFFKEKKEIQSVWRDPKRTIYNSATDAQASKKFSNYSCRCLSRHCGKLNSTLMYRLKTNFNNYEHRNVRLWLHWPLLCRFLTRLP
jgi:hypothetical protein